MACSQPSYLEPLMMSCIIKLKTYLTVSKQILRVIRNTSLLEKLPKIIEEILTY